MNRILPLLPLVGLLAIAAAFTYVDRTQAYRSPVAGPNPPAPREAALRDLDAFRKRKAEEKARLEELLRNLDTEKMVALGKEIVHGRGLCFNCHRVGSEGHGTQGPDLDGVGARAGNRIPGKTDVEYLTESLYHPRRFLVPGYPAAMTPANEPPIGLNDLEIRMVIAYLQSLGGTPTVTPDTELVP